MPNLHIKNASLSYSNKPIFTNLCLTLPANQWTCLLGASGVGKSSLLRLIAGLAFGHGAQANGDITSSDSLPVHHRVAWMAQQDLLLPWLSVIDNVTLGCRLRKEPLSKDKIEQAHHLLRSVGLQQQASSYPRELSGGQRQRVALARTLMEDRPFVLMDEPFAAVDALTRLKLQDLASELLADRTILMITHDPLEALRLGHSVYHLQGSPATLTEPLYPQGSAPRSLDNEQLMALHGHILEKLRQEDV
ncbi:ABC transporter ATP-binding protein [Kistimonas scapharcae]|uniref:ABC transporter ATP-binding protein n=1 Tax=Kistimonas scapharcae TaxID=1036133 RepID=A0ABP8UZH3_9GAMM